VTRAARGIIRPRVTDTVATQSALFCPDCGYDLQAIESDRCPECGLIIDRTALGQSVIPWLHRSSIGRFRAFWRTVNMATFRPRQLAQELVHPARFRDAVLFRRLVVLEALIPLGLIFVGGYLLLLNESSGGMWSPMDPLGSALQLCMIPVGWLCLALFLFAVSGVSSYFFHPRSIPVVQQNRAIAISYYACAPLAYTLITAPLLVLVAYVGGTVFDRLRSPIVMGLAWLIALVPIGLQIASMIRLFVVLVRLCTQCGSGRQWALGVFLPVFWYLAHLVLLWALPAAMATIGLIVLSLRP
jgi:hypothetical protein